MLNVVMLNVMAPLRIGKSDLEIQFYCISVGWHFWACWKGLQHCQCISGSVVSAITIGSASCVGCALSVRCANSVGYITIV
jgi:hypothetical protein